MILRRNDENRFSTILRKWAGKTVVLIGGGPSLTLAQIDMVCEARVVKDYRVIAVNDAYLWAPWADLLYAADYRWWTWHSLGIAKPALGLTADQVRERYHEFAGQRCTIQHGDCLVDDLRVHVLKNLTFPNHGTGISLDPQALVTGRNSIFQALNLTILTGAPRVILLGVDGKMTLDGKTHFHGGHPVSISFSMFYEEMRKAFSASERAIKATGIEVLNCSPGSAIDNFPKVPLEAAL